MDLASLRSISVGHVMLKNTSEQSDQWNVTLDSTIPAVLITYYPKSEHYVT